MNESKDVEKKGHIPIIYRIYNEMLDHVGVDNAISAKELSAKFGITERKLREYVSEMRRSNELEKVVMSCNDGYFVCTSAEEFDRAVQRLLSAAFDLLKTARATEKKAGHAGQVKIKVGELYNEICEPFGKTTGDNGGTK